MIKTTQLQNLHDGDRFQIPFLKDLMRNLQVCRVGTCSVSIKGERLVEIELKTDRGESSEGDVGKWKPFAYSVALSTPVIYLEAGELPVEETPTSDINSVKSKASVPSTEASVKRGRGRPRNPDKVIPNKSEKGRGRPAKVLNIKFPESGEFTIDDVAKASGCKKYDVVNYLAKMKKAGTPIMLIEKGKLLTSKRGRATSVYSLK
jgi:hypothetical protein